MEKFDISKHDEIEKFVDSVCDQLGGCPEILINNAGIGSFGELSEVKISHFEQTFSTNVFGLTLITQVLRLLLNHYYLMNYYFSLMNDYDDYYYYYHYLFDHYYYY